VSGDRTQLTVRERELLGSAESRRLRRQGWIPGVLYGKGSPRAIAVQERDLRGALTGRSGLHAVLDVVLDGQTTVHPSILKDYQQDPIKGRVAHVDLQEVRLDQPIQATVTVTLLGEPAGVKVGGVLNQVAATVSVEALPMEVPEHIDADISAMEIGDTLRLADLTAPEGVTFLDDPDETVIATVAVPRVEIEEPTEEEAEEAELAEGEEAPEGAAAEEAPAAEAEASGEGEPGTVEG
jgi:large subunit ribosomal protein L25